MNRRQWFMGFLLRSLAQRRGRVAVAASAVMVASAVVVCGLGLSLGIRAKLGGELKAYGANAIVSPSTGQYIEQNVYDSISRLEGIQQASGQLYIPVTVGETRVELIGLERQSVEGWRLVGSLPGDNEALIGSRLQEALGVSSGEGVEFSYAGKVYEATVSGVVERGGDEDRALLLMLPRAQEIAGLEGRMSAILLRVDSSLFDRTVPEISRLFPDVQIKTLRQVAFAEESFLDKIELLMFLVGIVVLAATTISVTSTMSATVLERMKEIGLMRAIGATKGDIRLFYFAEGGIIGLMGGLAGFLVGLLAAETVSRGAFGSYIGIPAYLVLVALALGTVISVTASMGPLAGAMRQRPAVVLRGE